MGGSKSAPVKKPPANTVVDANKYISKPDESRDTAILTAMMQAQFAQQARQAELIKAASQIPTIQQTYDPLMESKRLGELGMVNAQRSRELEKQASPEAAAMREAQTRDIAALTSPEAANQYLNEWAKRQGLIQGIETGLQDSTIGQAATYDAALQARQNQEQQNIALQQQLLQQMQAPVGGIDPTSSISAQQAAQGQNLASMQNWQNAMYGNIEGYNQSIADQMSQLGANFQNLQQSSAQNRQNYMQAMLNQSAANEAMKANQLGIAQSIQAQNEAAKNAMTGAWVGAAGSAIGGAAGGIGARYGGGGGGGSGITGYGGQTYVPKSGGSYYAPLSGSISSR